MQQLPETNKNLGQHWLTDQQVLQDIAMAAGIQPEDTVLEIGPGPGTLTALLCQMAKQVVAVEFDQKLARELPGRVTADNLRVVCQDILSFDLTSLPPGYKVVANIPYYLTSNLIRVLSETNNYPETAVLLIQKEVAQRVAAAPGDMSLLSVTAQFYWHVTLGREVKSQLFVPPPKVDSQVVILQRRSELLLPGAEVMGLFRTVKFGFTNRRKTLGNSLMAGFHVPKDAIREKLIANGIDAGRRPQELSIEEWIIVHNALAEYR